MDSCDVLIVGGGPAGSSCAWGLRPAGLRVIVADRAEFPRDKICGGWVTPSVLRELNVDPADYSPGRVLQPISAFLVSCMGQREVKIGFPGAVSYGIRRREFDEFLLRRSGASLRLDYPVTRIERTAEGWLVNGEIKARLLVGAAGHFCPVARYSGARKADPQAVVAQEMEFEMTPGQAERCRIRPQVPELFFCRDLKGYGWCFRKGNYLNIGLGRLDPNGLPGHVRGFSDFLRGSGRIGFELTSSFRGHAYLLAGDQREVVRQGLMLIGDSAGLAAPFSGEGIRPAVLSGLWAAEIIQRANGDYSLERLQHYQELLRQRLAMKHGLGEQAVMLLPEPFRTGLARALMRTHWFCGKVVGDWFLQGDTKPATLTMPPRQEKEAIAG